MVYQTTCEQSKAQFSLTSGGPRVTSGTPDYAEPGKRRSRSQNPDDLVLIPVFSSKWTENGSFPWVRKKEGCILWMIGDLRVQMHRYRWWHDQKWMRNSWMDDKRYTRGIAVQVLKFRRLSLNTVLSSKWTDNGGWFAFIHAELLE